MPTQDGLPSDEACDVYANDPSDAQVAELLRWGRSEDPNLRACAAYGASLCSEFVPEAAELLRGLLGDASDFVRFAAALEGALQYWVEVVDPELMAGPLDCTEAFRDSVADAYESLPFFGGASLAGRYAIAVGTLAEHAFPLAKHVLALLERDPVPQEAIEIGRGLLLLTFSGTDRRFHPNFVQHLETLASSKAFFVLSADAYAELRDYGLTEHGGLDAIVGALRASGDPLATFGTLMGFEEA